MLEPLPLPFKKIQDSAIAAVCNRVLTERFAEMIRDHTPVFPTGCDVLEPDPIYEQVQTLLARVNSIDNHVVTLLKGDFHNEINGINHDMQRIIDAICELRPQHHAHDYDPHGMVNVELLAARKELAAAQKSMAALTTMNAVLRTKLDHNCAGPPANNYADGLLDEKSKQIWGEDEGKKKSGSTSSRR